MEREINCTYVFPPIPLSDFTTGRPPLTATNLATWMGWGATREEAMADLLEQCE